MSRMIHVVRFFHDNKWMLFKEYGPTMEDVAIDKAYQLSAPFGDAEVRKVQIADQMKWEDGILLEMWHVKNTVLETHIMRGA